MKHVTLHTPRSPELSAGIVSFDVDGMRAGEVVERLLEKKVIATTSPYRVSNARLAAGVMNTHDDVEQALRAVRALA